MYYEMNEMEWLAEQEAIEAYEEEEEEKKKN